MDSDASPRRTRSSAVLVVVGSTPVGSVMCVVVGPSATTGSRSSFATNAVDASRVPVGQHRRHVGSRVDQKTFEGFELRERFPGCDGDFGLLGRLPGLIRGERVGGDGDGRTVGARCQAVVREDNVGRRARRGRPPGRPGTRVPGPPPPRRRPTPLRIPCSATRGMGGVPGRRTAGASRVAPGSGRTNCVTAPAQSNPTMSAVLHPTRRRRRRSARSPATISSSSSLGGGSCRPISARRSSFSRGSARLRAWAGPLRPGLPALSMTATLRPARPARRARPQSPAGRGVSWGPAPAGHRGDSRGVYSGPRFLTRTQLAEGVLANLLAFASHRRTLGRASAVDRGGGPGRSPGLGQGEVRSVALGSRPRNLGDTPRCRADSGQVASPSNRRWNPATSRLFAGSKAVRKPPTSAPQRPLSMLSSAVTRREDSRHSAGISMAPAILAEDQPLTICLLPDPRVVIPAQRHMSPRPAFKRPFRP